MVVEVEQQPVEVVPVIAHCCQAGFVDEAQLKNAPMLGSVRCSGRFGHNGRLQYYPFSSEIHLALGMSDLPGDGRAQGLTLWIFRTVNVPHLTNT